MARSYNTNRSRAPVCSKQFSKAGEYQVISCGGKFDSSSTDELDHARVHPKFLHSNATSHKWALGAIAELLDNAIDEVKRGATYVNVDVLDNKKDGSKMLLVEDNGGGMNPEKMRECMSFGYTEKANRSDTIGRYGNGFKTSTMRLGSDVIVFSRCGRTRSIGLLSYTFLRSTGKQDIVVPILDYEKRKVDEPWTKMLRSSRDTWNKSIETILEWSPFESEKELDHQFHKMRRPNGTRIIIYNLWENDEGQLELDLDTDCHDIQLPGKRDEKNVQMAEQYPNSMHFLTYKHSLRSYAAILYFELPRGFQIILRGKEVEHHKVLDDLMSSKPKPETIKYKPKPIQNEDTNKSKDTNIVAQGYLGFVKDASNHIDVQGFNVYHKNRLIMPFWRVWTPAGSEGRGVLGVIKAGFLNPAHDKQEFENTDSLRRLKLKLIELQRDYWKNNCQEVGYKARRNKQGEDARSGRKRPLPFSDSDEDRSSSTQHKCRKVATDKSPKTGTAHAHGNENVHRKNTMRSVEGLSSKPHANMHKPSSATATKSGQANKNVATSTEQRNPSRTVKAKKSDKEVQHRSPSQMEQDTQSEEERTLSGGTKSLPATRVKVHKNVQHHSPSHMVQDAQSEEESTPSGGTNSLPATRVKVHKNVQHHSPSHMEQDAQSEEESTPAGGTNSLPATRMKVDSNIAKQPKKEIEGNAAADLPCERKRCKSLEAQLQKAKEEIKELKEIKKVMERKEESLFEMFNEEIARHADEENNLNNKLRDASKTIRELQECLEEMSQPKRLYSLST